MPSIHKICKRIGLASILPLIGLLACLSANAARFRSRQINCVPNPKILLDERAAISRLSEAIQIPTISTQHATRQQLPEFVAFQEHIQKAFPTLFRTPLVVRTGEQFGDPRNLSLLFQWPGTDPALPPLLLLAHYDVVPVESDALPQWTHPPFSGQVDDEFVWGRGALDSKDSVCGILESATYLIESGFEPTRSIYIALGHDEELGGAYGNRQIAEWLRKRGIRLHAVFDEGGCILSDFPGVSRPVALVGIGEKGYASIELTARIDSGGHSSMPPNETAIGVLAQAINRIASNPFPMRLDGGADLLMNYVGPEMKSPFSRLATANRWLFAPLVKQMLASTPSGNASLRTTMVPTIIQGGIKENVLPSTARATLNIRLLPGDTVNLTIERIQSIIDDARISVRLLPNDRPAPPLSPPDSPAFELLQRTIGGIYSDAIVAPFVLVGSTDSSHYVDLCRDVFRFTPIRLNQSELAMFHGVNERISRRDYLDLVQFYVALIRNFTQLEKDSPIAPEK